MSLQKQPKVAVIGLGAQGLVAVKNLLEQGFDVTGFDKNNYIGGIWHYCAENQLSALPTTVVNISRERGSFTDFPFPPDTGSFPNAGDIDAYLNSYCEHFNLKKNLQLGTAIKAISRNESQDRWELTAENVQSQAVKTISFDKIVLAVGPHSRPRWPDIENRDYFQGEFSHSISFKDPQKFANKRIVVVGVSNSAADTATSLTNHASKVYLAHRDGCYVLPRHLKDGSSIDHGLTYRLSLIIDYLDIYMPSFSRLFLDSFLGRIMKSFFGTLSPSWRILPAPGVLNQVPTVSDTLIPALKAGAIESTQVPIRILPNSKDIELADGTILKDIDTIICCTGYSLDLSILGLNDPTLLPNGKNDTHHHPRLYQNIFSLSHPHSLAFIGIAIALHPALLLSDLSSMALAQLWSNTPGSPSLPSQLEMEDWYRIHCEWVLSVRRQSPRGKIIKLLVRQRPWLEFVQASAGTNIAENLGYGSGKAWRFWWEDRTFCTVLMDGVFSPYVYRLFEGEREREGIGRKKWEGAREAIEVVDKSIRRRKEQATRTRKEGEKSIGD